MYVDPIYLLFTIPGAILAFGAKALLMARVAAGHKVQVQCGLTGEQVAKKILEHNGITNVKVEEVSGVLTDHYSPREKTLRLSPEIFRGKTVTAMGVAAHEVGHAIQDQKQYAPLVVRQTVAPAAMIGSNLAFGLIFLGMVLQWAGAYLIACIVFSVFVFFTLITLPVEYDASARARAELEGMRLTYGDEALHVRKVLSAAALTYVAAAATAILQFLYFLMKARR